MYGYGLVLEKNGLDVCENWKGVAIVEVCKIYRKDVFFKQKKIDVTSVAIRFRDKHKTTPIFTVEFLLQTKPTQKQRVVLWLARASARYLHIRGDILRAA